MEDEAVGRLRAALTRCRIATAAEGFAIRYLDRADLIRMPRAVGRPKDLRRAEELQQLTLDS